MTLPPTLGSLVILNRTSIANDEYNPSKEITGPQVNQILTKSSSYDDEFLTKQKTVKSAIRLKKSQRIQHLAVNVMSQSNSDQKRCIELAKKRGASSWLQVWPIKSHGFALH